MLEAEQRDCGERSKTETAEHTETKTDALRLPRNLLHRRGTHLTFEVLARELQRHRVPSALLFDQLCRTKRALASLAVGAHEHRSHEMARVTRPTPRSPPADEARQQREAGQRHGQPARRFRPEPTQERQRRRPHEDPTDSGQTGGRVHGATPHPRAVAQSDDSFHPRSLASGGTGNPRMPSNLEGFATNALVAPQRNTGPADAC